MFCLLTVETTQSPRPLNRPIVPASPRAAPPTPIREPVRRVKTPPSSFSKLLRPLDSILFASKGFSTSKDCSERSPAGGSTKWPKITLRRAEGARRLVDFLTAPWKPSKAPVQLPLKVQGRMTHNEAHKGLSAVTAKLGAMSLEAYSAQLCARRTSSVEDRWIGGNRSVPSKESFMMGPDKLQAISDLKRAVVDCKSGGVVAAVGAKGWVALGRRPPV
jgi:hypothetical protein